jgi:hypothetical protein
MAVYLYFTISLTDVPQHHGSTEYYNFKRHDLFI